MEIAPTHLNSEYITRTANTLNTAKLNATKIILNLNHLKFSLPIGILSIGSSIKDFLNYRSINSLETEVLPITADTAAIGYLKHIGFFQYIGINLGNHIGAACGSSTYIPIKKSQKKIFSKKKKNYKY